MRLPKWVFSGGTIALALATLLACSGNGATETAAPEQGAEAEALVLALPELSAVQLNGRPLQVVATTSLIGDVVGNIGGEAIALTVLMDAGQDPHSYEPGAADLTAVADADVVFVNGWNLEEGLVDDLSTIAEEAPLIPISAGVEPLVFGVGNQHTEDSAQEHGGADPHVWFAVQNVKKWAENTEAVLRKLDPPNAAVYRRNLERFTTELENLQTYMDEQIAMIPAEKRKLVTNHDSLAYLAAIYDFEVVGTVIPAASTLAEPSASDLAELVQTMAAEGVCTIFTENTVSGQLADTVAAELSGCDKVTVLPLFTGSLGPAGSGAENYIGLMRTNTDTIVRGLQ